MLKGLYYRFTAVSVKVPMNRTKTNSCKIGMTPHETPDSESNQEKKEQSSFLTLYPLIPRQQPKLFPSLMYSSWWNGKISTHMLCASGNSALIFLRRILKGKKK